MTRKSRALGGRSVARTYRDGRLKIFGVQPLRGLTNANQRRAKISFHVHGQRLDRRNIQNPARMIFLCGSLKHQPVNAPQKSREGFAGSGRRQYQGGFAARDRRPAHALRRCRLCKDRPEPVADGRMEQFKAVSSDA